MDVIYPEKTIRNQGTKNKEKPVVLHKKLTSQCEISREAKTFKA